MIDSFLKRNLFYFFILALLCKFQRVFAEKSFFPQGWRNKVNESRIDL